ncbi:MAG TPA: DUF523 domain-containing protein [Candidatus Omnitrophota bacterium]|nr:DUF523 domain-containing protein [Candidatus Omnitrophota bacterium]HQO57842.1 DUF523 domain-containing protein [Candidatus Omnitrophota bacterium]
MMLCSACLLGVCCRYDAESKPHQGVVSLLGREIVIPVCPEQWGGLPTPRLPSEIQGRRVVAQDGTDVTQAFQRGAQEVLKMARLMGIKKALLKQRSPSCGCGQVYDGSFSGKIISGDGVTASLLKSSGIEIWTEESFPFPPDSSRAY